MTIDSQTLDEWEQRANAMIKYIALAEGDPCDSPYPDMKKLIEEIRKLQEREAAFRLALNSIKRAASEDQPTLRDKSFYDIADKVLQRYPEEKEEKE